MGRPRLGAVARGALGVDVVGPHLTQRRQDRDDRLEVGARLDAAPEDAERARARARQPLHRDGADRPGAHRGDPGGVHDRLRQTGLRVVQDQKARDVRQPDLQISREAADPLDARRAEGADVRRHRVDEVVAAGRTGVDPRLGRHLDAPEPLLAEGGLETLDDRAHRDAGRLDVGARQVQELARRHPERRPPGPPAGGPGRVNPRGRSGAGVPWPRPKISCSPALWPGVKSRVRIGYGTTIPSRR